MKKAIVWFIAGCIAATSFSAYAEEVVESMIGKVVDGTFKVRVQDKVLDSIVIEGTTYLPVRAFANATGYLVNFDQNEGVTLKKKVSGDRDTYVKTIEVLKGGIKRNNEAILYSEEELAKIPDTEANAGSRKNLELNIQNAKKELESNTKQLAMHEQLLAEYDAQNTELTQ